MNRRELLATTGAAVLGAALAPFARAARPESPRRILLFTKSSGYEHSVIKRADGKPGFAEQIVTDLGARNDFEVVCTKDGTLFTAENLARFDAFFFYTTGDLLQPGTDKNPPMTPQGKDALLQAVRSGKGFIGTHAAADSFHTPPELPERANRYVDHGQNADPYVRMLGAEFIKHGPQQVSRSRVIDPRFPGFDRAGEGFDLMEEWYGFHDYSPDIHVLLVQETRGMNGADYQRAPYPSTWARSHGRGRVFYTSMGHREDVWTNPLFQSILLGGIAWALQRVEAEIAPNLPAAAPGYRQIPPKGK